MKTKLRELRTEKGMTQEQLAEMLGQTKRIVGAWEREDTEINLCDACAICDIFDCSLDEFALHKFPGFSSNEQRIINDYRACDAEHKRMLETNARLYAGDSKKQENSSHRNTVEGIA